MGNKTKSERRLFCLKIFCRCKKAGNLVLSKGEGDYLEQSELGFRFFFADGHTTADDSTYIQYNGKTCVLFSNSRTHTNSYVMGFDTRLLTMPEKTKFLNAAADNITICS
jgi:hypothetical protein